MPLLARIYRTLPLDQLVTSNLTAYRLIRGLAQRYDIFLPHEPDFAAFKLFPPRPGLFLDIGANDGMAARSFRVFNRTTPILSLEPNTCHDAALRACQRRLNDFTYMLVGAGEHQQMLQLFTPFYRGIPLTSYTSFNVEEARRNLHTYLHMPNMDASLTFTATNARIIPVDWLGLRVGFVKIDVEGYEVPVLRGMFQTLQRERPIVMVEYNRTNANQVADLLISLGYCAMVYDARLQQLRSFKAQQALNLFYLPPEVARSMA